MVATSERVAFASLVLAIVAASCWALAGGAIYLGTWDGSTVFVQVDLEDQVGPPVAEAAPAAIRLRSEPAPGATVAGAWFDAAAQVEWREDLVALDGTAASWNGAERAPWWPVAEPGDGLVHVLLEAATVPGTQELDPFGSATLTCDVCDGRGRLDLVLTGIGTVFSSHAALADGTLDVLRETPFPYAEPWSTLDLIEAVHANESAVLADGIAQRRALPRSVVGIWTDQHTAHVASLTPRIVSILYASLTFAGGAHPTTLLSSRTWVRAGDGWRDAGLCDALASLQRSCPTDELRATVIEDLARQQAAWVVAGEVTVDTPWLLDTFTVTASGIRFEFSPHDVGPYAEGMFVAFVPFTAIAGR